MRASASRTSRSTATSGGMRQKTCVISTQAQARSSIEIGAAMTNQTPKEIGGASGRVIWKIRSRERFGGVPTRVAMPPAEQA